MPKPIRSILAAAGLLAVAALAAAGVLVVGESPAHADCTISGPTSVSLGQSFTLCGPSVRNSTYEWTGPGLSTSEYGRCVDVQGLDRGGYEFTLVRRVNGVEVERCTKVVNVGGSTGGTESCIISGPTTIDAGQRATLCAPQDGLHTYAWTGPNGFTSSAGCITVGAEGTYYLNSRNRITGSSRTCSHRLDVAGYGGGDDNGGTDQGDCAISGPSTIPSGASVALCGPSFSNTSYRWTGPNGFVSSSRCINADDPGVYYLTMRNNGTGYQRRCSRTLDAAGNPGDNDCISGPSTIPAGSSATLCAPSYGNTSYRWTGPDGFVSSSRCIRAESGGTYYLVMRDLGTGRVTRCNTSLTVVDEGGGNGNDNPDNPISGNCPQGFQFWRTVAAQSRNRNGAELSRNEYWSVARAVDAKSSYFNWANDGDGFASAVNPAAPQTRRKQVIRQFAALLANVAAAEMNITSSNGTEIGLDADTPVSFGGASTVGELIALTDRLLAGNRGDFAKLNATLNRINRGIGIPTSCE